jgi:hypothetical protein
VLSLTAAACVEKADTPPAEVPAAETPAPAAESPSLEVRTDNDTVSVSGSDVNVKVDADD